MGPNTTGRLDSWKEIADYLRRDISTVRRWEAKRGLPVHRLPGSRRAAVFAYKSEIDAWMKTLESSGTPGFPDSSQIGTESLPVSGTTGLAAVRAPKPDAEAEASPVRMPASFQFESTASTLPMRIFDPRFSPTRLSSGSY